MCGISGIFANYIQDQHKQLVENIMNSQTARGPDHQAMSIIKDKKSQIVLGHNRLSIIDLSENANQPMWDITERYCVVYNGEIYNYIELRAELQEQGANFKTSSDTEVILNAFAFWGVAALDRFCGPFAFALFDKKLETLWICRDRFAIRPLYYTIKNNILYFASTTSVLARHLNLQPNLSYIARGLKYLVYEDGSESCAYHNLLSLPAAHYLQASFTNNHLTTEVKNYYNLAQNVAELKDDFASSTSTHLLECIENQLEEAVKIRLRTDVPLGISLSGGLDSSSVAAMVRQKHSNTIGFSFANPNNKNTEGPLVAHCANYLNIKIEYVWPTQEAMVDALHKTILAQDAPFASLSVVAQYLLYHHVRASGVKVLLGGQGGDEAFMGYKKFLLFLIKQGFRQRRYLSSIKNLLSLFPMLVSEMTSLPTYWQQRHRYSRNANQHFSVLNLPDHSTVNLTNINQPLWHRQMQDITQYSLPTLLRYEDRNAMGNSVESRLPYMDHKLIETGLALPEALKLNNGYGKWAIREIMQNKIPDQIRLARYKRGFDIPLTPLLQAGLGKFIRLALNDSKKNIERFLKVPPRIDEFFSDRHLLYRQNAMAEAITLLWLNKVSS